MPAASMSSTSHTVTRSPGIQGWLERCAGMTVMRSMMLAVAKVQLSPSWSRTGREACPTALRQRIQTPQTAGLECRDLGFVPLNVAHLVDAFEEAVLRERFHGELGRSAVGKGNRLSR